MPAKRPGESDSRFSPQAMQTGAAAHAAAAIGGPELDRALRPLAEAGRGVAEGFELAEQELIEAAEHGESSADPCWRRVHTRGRTRPRTRRVWRARP